MCPAWRGCVQVPQSLGCRGIPRENLAFPPARNFRAAAMDTLKLGVRDTEWEVPPGRSETREDRSEDGRAVKGEDGGEQEGGLEDIQKLRLRAVFCS